MSFRVQLCRAVFACGLGTAVLSGQTSTVPAAAVAPMNAPAARALLLFFVASDCPVSNRYYPEMERLEQRFASQGVVTRFVYPNAGETAASAGAHQAAFGASQADARLDPGAALAHATGADTTPESVLLLREGALWRVAYRGRIDDRYVHIGVERAHAEHHDLENALVAALAGRPVLPTAGPPVGCAIMSAQAMGTMR